MHKRYKSILVSERKKIKEECRWAEERDRGKEREELARRQIDLAGSRGTGKKCGGAWASVRMSSMVSSGPVVCLVLPN